MEYSRSLVVIVTGFAACLPLPALAHGGHLGDLAGHSHWAGLAAVLGAAALGVAAAKMRKRRRSQTDAGSNESEPVPGETFEPAKG